MFLALGLTMPACDDPASSDESLDVEEGSGGMGDGAMGSTGEGTGGGGAGNDGTDDGGADDDGADETGDDGDDDDGGEPAGDPACGDGVVNPERGEECDDGNVDELDGCRLDCSFGPTELRVDYDVSSPLEVRGGPDGVEFGAECPAGEVIIGVSGRSGGVIDQLQVQCGTIGLTSPQLGWIDISVEPGTAMETQGNGGGGAFWLQCPADHVVVGFGDRSNALVEMLSLRCAPLNLISDPETGALSLGFGPAFSTGATGGLGAEALTQLCPAGEVATSAQGRSDAHINAFGMTCRPLGLF